MGEELKKEVCPTRKGSFKQNTLNSFASLEQNIFTLRTPVRVQVCSTHPHTAESPELFPVCTLRTARETTCLPTLLFLAFP